MFRTARWRLVAWNVVVFGFLLLIIESAAYGVFQSRIYSSVDSELRQQEARVLAGVANPQYYDLFNYFTYEFKSFPPDFQVVTITMKGRVHQTGDCPAPQLALVFYYNCYGPLSALSASAMKGMLSQANNYTADSATGPLVASIDDIRSTTVGNQPYRVLTFAVLFLGKPIGIMQIGRSISGETSSLQQLRILLLFGGVFSIVLATGGSIFLADRALVPIRQAFSRQRQFTADASHELRTPLTLIRANAEMLYRNATPDQGELIGEIIRETDHLNRLVGDLLTLARADNESLMLVSRPVDFRALVSSVHEDLHAIAESYGIDTALALDGPVTITGDEGRLRQLLLILLDNALKYTDPGGRVDVAVHVEDNRARLVVSDTGIGIPAADLPHIFERFYRVDLARGHESGGTGLGLSIARWIVQAHHGSIKVDSEAGKGARFQVELPVS